MAIIRTLPVYLTEVNDNEKKKLKRVLMKEQILNYLIYMR